MQRRRVLNPTIVWVWFVIIAQIPVNQALGQGAGIVIDAVAVEAEEAEEPEEEDVEEEENPKEDEEAGDDDSKDVNVLKAGSKGWSYYDEDKAPPEDWFEKDFDAKKWSKGAAPLGYGDNGLKATLSYGSDAGSKIPSAYFRTTIEVKEEATKSETLAFGIRADDGAVIYLNGEELKRIRMPVGAIRHQTLASEKTSGNRGEEGRFDLFQVEPEKLAKGENVLAVSVHQADVGSSDLVLDFEILGIEKARFAKLKKQRETPVQVIGQPVPFDWKKQVMMIFDNKMKEEDSRLDFLLQKMKSLIQLDEDQIEELTAAKDAAGSKIKIRIEKEVEECEGNQQQLNRIYQEVYNGGYSRMKSPEYTELFEAILDDSQRDSYIAMVQGRKKRVRSAVVKLYTVYLDDVLILQDKQKEALAKVLEDCIENPRTPNAAAYDRFGLMEAELRLRLNQSDESLEKIFNEEQKNLVRRNPQLISVRGRQTSGFVEIE